MKTVARCWKTQTWILLDAVEVTDCYRLHGSEFIQRCDLKMTKCSLAYLIFLSMQYDMICLVILFVTFQTVSYGCVSKWLNICPISVLWFQFCFFFQTNKILPVFNFLPVFNLQVCKCVLFDRLYTDSVVTKVFHVAQAPFLFLLLKIHLWCVLQMK
jgi:hypothetical protein